MIKHCKLLPIKSVHPLLAEQNNRHPLTLQSRVAVTAFRRGFDSVFREWNRLALEVVARFAAIATRPAASRLA